MRARNKALFLLFLALWIGVGDSGCKDQYPASSCPYDPRYPYDHPPDPCAWPPPPPPEITPSPCCQEFDDYAFLGLSEEDRRGLEKLKDFSWKNFAYMATSALVYREGKLEVREGMVCPAHFKPTFTYGVTPVNFVFSPVALLEILYLYTSFALPDTQTIEELKGFLPFYAKASSEPPLPVEVLHTIFSHPRQGTGGERRVLNNLYLTHREDFPPIPIPKEWILGSRPRLLYGDCPLWVQATVNSWVSAETGGSIPEFFPGGCIPDLYFEVGQFPLSGILISAYHFRSLWFSGLLGDSDSLKDPGRTVPELFFTGLRGKGSVKAVEMYPDLSGRVLRKEGSPGYEAFLLDLAEETRTSYTREALWSAGVNYYPRNFLYLMIMPPRGREFLGWFQEFVASREYEALLKEITRGTEAGALFPRFRIQSFYFPDFWGRKGYHKNPALYETNPYLGTPGIFPTLWGKENLVLSRFDPQVQFFLPTVPPRLPDDPELREIEIARWREGYNSLFDFFRLYHRVEVNVNAFGINPPPLNPSRSLAPAGKKRMPRGSHSPGPPLSVMVNRPFLFVVYHFPTQIPVLMGMVVDPPEDSALPPG